MSETTPPNPIEESASENERFQDVDPFHEEIAHIHEAVLQLAEHDKQTEYRREYEVFLNAGDAEPYGPISISAETTGTPENLDGSILRIILPPETYTRETGGLFKWETILTFERRDGQTEARVMLGPSMSPKEAFAQVLERDDLPQELATIFVEMAESLVDKPDYDASGMNLVFPIPDEQYERYWQEVQTAMNTREEPVPVTMKWNTDSWHDPDTNEPPAIPLSNGEVLVGASLEAVTRAGKPTIESVNLSTTDYYFSLVSEEPSEPDDEDPDITPHDEDKQGTLYKGNVYVFQEFVGDSLPELTEDERRHNPYMIIPAAMSAVSIAEGENPRHITASPDYTSDPDAADDFGPAQRHAEFLYKKRLAIERSSFAFNPARAERVTKTLDAVMSILKKRYPNNPKETE